MTMLAIGDPFRELHGAVRSIANHISELRCMQGAEDSATACVRLTQAAHDVDGTRHAVAENAGNTRTTTLRALRRGVARASGLWSSQQSGSAATIGEHFTTAGSTGAKCGPLNRESYHALVITIGRLLSNPDHPEAATDNELGMTQRPSREIAIYSIRKQVLDALEDRPLWECIRQGLQRELSQVMTSITYAAHTKPAPHATAQGIEATVSLIDNVERAFHLIAHYCELIESTRTASDSIDRREPLSQLEDVLGTWLRKAAPARCRMLEDVFANLGDQEAVLRAVGNRNPRQELRPQVARLATEAIPCDADTTTTVGHCRSAIEHWRSIQPDGRRLTNNDQINARAHTIFWSHQSQAPRSYLGASLLLARACDAIAEIATNTGSDVAELRPALQLAHSLRKKPDWTRIEAAGKDIATVLDEQEALAEAVDLLLLELDLGTGRGDEAERARPDPGETVPSWMELSDRQQAVVEWLLTKPRGQSMTKSEILSGAPRVHDNGQCRPTLDELLGCGIVRKTESRRPQLRLIQIPSDTPLDLNRHVSWQ